MKKLIGVILNFLLIFNTGCYNYRDINRVFFALSGMIDVDDNNNVIIYSENFKSYRGKEEKNGSEVRVVFTGIGKTGFDAFSNVARKASHEINYSQIKAMLFTEDAAKYGLNNFLEGMDRNQKLSLRTFLFVYTSDPEHYKHMEMNDEQFVGIFLDNLMTSQGKVSNIPSIRFYDFLNQRQLGSKVNLIPIVKNITGDTRERIELCGAAVIKDDKMIDKISTNELISYQLVRNTVKTGIITCPHPQIKDKYVSYQLLKSKAKLSVDYDGKKVLFKKIIKLKVTLMESTAPLDFTDKNVLEQMKSDLENAILTDCFTFFEKFKEKNVDIYNVEKLFREKYPKENVENVISITEADPASEVTVQIDGGQDTLNFQ